ncbi:MAG: hypothetical protein NTU58_00860 [Candidatus Nealsonbacteria bacterium]|nr:hypothetical protein [Candidatus Nealsonbacteria bacterium]
MKKIIVSLIALSFLFGVIAPTFVSAIGEDSCTIRKNANQILGANCCNAVGTPQSYGTVNPNCASNANGATCCLFSSILNITNWMFLLLMVIAMLFIVIGAATILMSAGVEDKVKSGRNYIIYALVGLAAALLSYMLPYLMKAMIGA